MALSFISDKSCSRPWGCPAFLSYHCLLWGLISFAASPLHAILYLRASIPRPPPVRPLTPASTPDPFNMRTFVLASALLFLLGCSYSGKLHLKSHLYDRANKDINFNFLLLAAEDTTAKPDNIKCHVCKNKNRNKFIPCTDDADIQISEECKSDDAFEQGSCVTVQIGMPSVLCL